MMKGKIFNIILVAIVIFLGIVIAVKIYDSNLPIEVNISMTEYSGHIDYILYALDLDFDLVTMGANCYTGVQKNSFNTEKYGILYTEFRYCKSNESLIFRVYNSSKDQRLRKPKQNEALRFDIYGNRINYY